MICFYIPDETLFLQTLQFHRVKNMLDIVVNPPKMPVILETLTHHFWMSKLDFSYTYYSRKNLHHKKNKEFPVSSLNKWDIFYNTKLNDATLSPKIFSQIYLKLGSFNDWHIGQRVLEVGNIFALSGRKIKQNFPQGPIVLLSNFASPTELVLTRTSPHTDSMSSPKEYWPRTSEKNVFPEPSLMLSDLDSGFQICVGDRTMELGQGEK